MFVAMSAAFQPSIPLHSSTRRPFIHQRHACARTPAATAATEQTTATKPHTATLDAVVIGSGMGALTAAADLASRGAKVQVLERYLIPGGSSGRFERPGYVFDVGASMIFGFGNRGTTNLLTRALTLVGKRIDTIPDPVQVRYHLPGIDVRVHRDYHRFIEQLGDRFPAERSGIQKFYDECWSVFHSLNSMPLRSLEEPFYLLRVFFAHPLACVNLVRFLAVNAGDIARKYIKDDLLLKFIDMECYSWSVVPADRTPMINAGMVFSDRHYGGINYPLGGVGRIAEEMATGISERPGCGVRYGARVTKILFDGDRACGVRLADGSEVCARAVISNATRWDTFGERGLVEESRVPEAERTFRKRYVKSPSFCSMHIAVREQDLEISMKEEDGMDCHHIMLDDWDELETARDGNGTLFVSIPTVLDKSLAPPGMHIFHVFTPSWFDEWTDLSRTAYKAKKEAMLQKVVRRLQKNFPGIESGIEFAEVGSARTHRKFLGRIDGSYGPVAGKRLPGLLSMPFNRTDVNGLYCVGDSTFPGQGLNATAFSGFACGHRVAADLGFQEKLPEPLDSLLTNLLSRARLQL